MAGGRGTRMGRGLKPLLTFKGRPLIEWILEAASGCDSIENVFVAITPETTQIKDALKAEFIETKGKGFVEDLVAAIKQLGLKKTMVLSADLPLLTPVDLCWVIAEYKFASTPALAVYVPTRVYRDLGLQPSIEIDGLVPAGVNIVDGTDLNGAETRLVTENPRFAFNINTPSDLEKAIEFTEKRSEE